MSMAAKIYETYLELIRMVYQNRNSMVAERSG